MYLNVIVYFSGIPESCMSTHFVELVEINPDITVIYWYCTQGFEVFRILFLHLLCDVEGISQLVLSTFSLDLGNAVQHLHLNELLPRICLVSSR